MTHKIVLINCYPNSKNNEGMPIAIFDSIEAAREWLTNEDNLRYATYAGFKPTPLLTWEIHNSGTLHYGVYKFDDGLIRKLVIGQIQYIT